MNGHGSEMEAIARGSLQSLARELQAFSELLPDGLTDAADLLLEAQPGITVSGVGKSGIVARKLAATLRATGTPAFYLHAGDAAHGDVGMVLPDTVAILISDSGKSAELINIVPVIRQRRAKIIAMTCNRKSPLAELADVTIDCALRHGSFNGIVPTTSTGLIMALGDCLAEMLITARNITLHDIAALHPGGSIGDRTRKTVRDVMHSHTIPISKPETPIEEAAKIITQGGMGTVFVVENDKLVGIVTDGDIRRGITKGLRPAEPVSAIMSANPLSIPVNERAIVALDKMHSLKVSVLAVVDEQGALVGAISVHD